MMCEAEFIYCTTGINYRVLFMFPYLMDVLIGLPVNNRKPCQQLIIYNFFVIRIVLQSVMEKTPLTVPGWEQPKVRKWTIRLYK